jgi:GT2 family glycosyltransferase/polysaccharide pyruvyl transferase WcaK-like protein
MKIAHFGTFDVENYGDLLFPLLLERRLGRREVEFVHVSPVGGAPALKDCKPAIGFEEALADCESWDAIVFGGGALGHGESAGDVEKYRDPAIHTIAYPGLWLLPAFIAHLRGIPLVWNAPGIPGNFSEERKRQLMQWACWQADYLSVRDVQSATVLAESLVEAKVVPDTAVEVSNLWSDRDLRAEIARLKRRGEWPQSRYLALHLNERYADADLVALAEEIKQICGSRGATALLIAIGGCHGDAAFAHRVLSQLKDSPASVFIPDSLRSVAAAVRFSDGYIGSSLHGAITAYSFARPFLIVAKSLSKFAGFLAHVGAQDRLVATWAAAVEVVGHWPPSEQQTEIAGSQNKSVMEALDQHWGTLSERLTMRRPASSLAGAQLLETLSQMPPEWFPCIPMLERSPLFAPVIEKYRDVWNSVRRHLQNSAFVAAAAYRRLDLRHQKLILDISTMQAKLSEQRKAIERRDRQIEELQGRLAQERASASVLGEKFDKSENEKAQLKDKIALQAAAIERRDRWLGELQKKSEKEKSQLKDKISVQAAAIERRDSELAEQREKNRILKQALNTVEELFGKLRASRAFHFAIYTARRLGLVSRNPRRWIEEIKDQIRATRKALKMVKSQAHLVDLESQLAKEKETVRGERGEAQGHKNSVSSSAPVDGGGTGSRQQAAPKQIKYRFRVTIISSTTNIHGGTKRLLQIAQLLHLRGHHVTFVRHFACRELDWFKLDPPLREIRFDQHSSLADLEERLPDADILLTYGNNSAASLLNGLSRRKGLKYLLFMHFGVHDRRLDEANAALPSFHKLSTSNWIAEQLASLGSKASVIGFGIHSDQFFPIDSPRRFRVGTLLHREDWKGSADVIEAFKIVKKQLPEAQLVAFGQVKDPQLGVECEYHFDPDQNQLRDIYCSCSAWVTASLWEGIGMCSVEAMLCKTPLITTDTGGSRDFCHDENCMLVEKRSPSSIASAILRLLTDQEYGQRLAERAYADILEMNWGKCIERLEHVFLSNAQRENPTVVAQRRCELTIGIPIHNQPDYVQGCLRSIYENTASNFELILIDDQSDAQTQMLLRQALKADPERVRYIRNETRQGFPYNCNRIISNSCGRYICLLNSDTIVTHHWDRRLIDVLKTRPDLAITGPSTSYGVAKNHDRTAQQLDEVHARRFDMSYEEIQAFAATLQDREASSVEETEYLNGFCMMLNSEIIPKVGFFDEKFGLGSREEVEFIDRVRMAGYGCGWVKYAYVHHYGNRSFDPYGVSTKQLWEKNKQLYFKARNQQKQVLVTEKRIAFLYTSKLTNSTRKRTFEIARKLQRYLDVETFYLPAVSADVFRDFDIFILQRLGGLSENMSPELVDETLGWIEQYRSEGKVFLYDLDDYVLDAQGGIPRRLIQYCDGAIASTPHLQKLIEPLNPRCLCLKNGLDYDRFLAAPPAELELGRFHVVCASLGAVGQTALSQIAAKIKSRHPEIEMHFFRDSNYCQKQLHLTLHSMVNLDELFGYMKAADVVVNFDLPDAIYRQQLEQQYGILDSQLNDFINAKSGLKYYNAAAAAKSFVSTPQPSCYAQMIQHGVNGFLAESIDDFVDIILRLHDDRNLGEKVGQRAFEDVLANYTLDQTIFDYLKAICQVLPGWQSKPRPDPDDITSRSRWTHELAET